MYVYVSFEFESNYLTKIDPSPSYDWAVPRQIVSTQLPGQCSESSGHCKRNSRPGNSRTTGSNESPWLYMSCQIRKNLTASYSTLSKKIAQRKAYKKKHDAQILDLLEFGRGQPVIICLARAQPLIDLAWSKDSKPLIIPSFRESRSFMEYQFWLIHIAVFGPIQNKFRSANKKLTIKLVQRLDVPVLRVYGRVHRGLHAVEACPKRWWWTNDLPEMGEIWRDGSRVRSELVRCVVEIESDV